jgi:hypothetical protein
MNPNGSTGYATRRNILGSDFNLRCQVSLLFGKSGRGGRLQHPVKAGWKFLCARVETALEFVIAPTDRGH